MLTRNNSKSNLKNHQDMQRCFEQKNAMIYSLQGQVQDLRINQQKYNRAYEDLIKIREKYEKLTRDCDSQNQNQSSKLEISNKNICELRIQIDHLQLELNNKTQAHRDQKFQTQLLLEKSHQKDGESSQVKAKAQQLKNQADVLSMETQRNIGQIGLMKQQLDKQKKDLQNVRKTSDSIGDKVYKTQNYLRNLTREQISTSDQLARLEEDNNYLDRCIQELQITIERNNEECNLIRKQNQLLNFQLSTKQLEKKKIDKEQKEKNRLNGIQKQKNRVVLDQLKQRENQFARISIHLKDSQEQVNQFVKNNTQIQDINKQLKQDLDVCFKHLENLQRNNKSLDEEVDRLQQVNQNIIKMLQNPNQVKRYSITATTFGKQSRNTSYGCEN